MQNRPHEVDRDPQGLLARAECFALDLDGTLFLGRQWVAGAQEFLAQLEERGKRALFMTNNTSFSTEGHLGKLASMGLPVGEDALASAGLATIEYLRRHHAGRRVSLLGAAPLAMEFAQKGILLDDEAPEVVVTAFDTTLTWKKLARTCRFVRQGLPWLATHPDINCPTEEGPVPDIGSIHAAITASTGRTPHTVIGKPEAPIFEYLHQKTGVPPGHTALVGDRLYTDIAGARASSLLPVLVLSGETQAGDLAASPHQPALVFTSVKQMLPFL